MEIAMEQPCPSRCSGGRRDTSGFTFLELVIALAVTGVLFSIVPTTFAGWIAGQQVANHARHLAESMEIARSEAIKHGYRVNLCRSVDGRQCATAAGGWESGWLMFVDDNNNGEIDDEETVLRSEGPAQNAITVHSNRPVQDYISYTSLGHARLQTGALQMGTLIVCKPGQDALNVVIANSGRTRIDKTRNRCS
jgi:type IV fimbrial biogenesis protein FimT